jgi:hypothetical protein
METDLLAPKDKLLVTSGTETCSGVQASAFYSSIASPPPDLGEEDLKEAGG